MLGAWFPGGSPLTKADFAVLAAALTAALWTARGRGRPATDARAYLSGGRAWPWWAALLAFMAAETSAVTLVSIPASSFRDDWRWAQVLIGSAGARVLVAALFLPAFERAGGGTVYAWLGERFGDGPRRAAAALFLATRLLASGVRLAAAAVVLGTLLGWAPGPVIALLAAAAWFCAEREGLDAVMRVNLLQTCWVMGAAGVAAVFLLRRVDGGLPAAFRLADEAGKLQVFRWAPAPGPGLARRFLADPDLLAAALLSGFAGGAAAFGADHAMTQKLLAAPDGKARRAALLASIAGSALTLGLLLGVGTLLFAYYKQNPGMALPDSLDQIFPHFAAQVMPRFWRGAVAAALALAALDLPLTALSAALVTDLLRPFAGAAPGRELALSRAAVAFFAAALAGTAWALSRGGPVWLALKIGGVAYGPLLGVFLLGLTTRDKGGPKACTAAMAACAGLGLWLLRLSETGALPLAWSWLVPLGAAATYGLAWALAPALDGKR